MRQRLSAAVLGVYTVLLIKVMIFKDLPTIHVGHVMFNFGGVERGHPANFIPFTTILPYFMGYKGVVIAGVNLVGNVALLVPVGFLLPLVYPYVSWRKMLAVAVLCGLLIEVSQAVLQIGIFDIDDVILNALGVMVGYGSVRFMRRYILTA
jgi:glycopeptide antibiotics resistance protein